MFSKLTIKKAKKCKLAQATKQNGQALAELCAGLLVAIPLLFLAVDAAFIMIGAALNDQICIAGARAAASGPPSEYSLSPQPRLMGSNRAPAQRVHTVIDNIYYAGLPMKVRDSFRVTEVLLDFPPESTGGAIKGELDVGTTIDIYPPFSFPGYGHITLTSQHYVPFTYVRPAS